MTDPERTAEAEQACPGATMLERIAAGQAVPEAARRHVDACPGCATRVARIAADNALIAEFVDANADRLAAAQSIEVGTAPSGYRIEAEIHRGAQGIVYRARQEATRRTVALKVTLRGAFATDRQRRRFDREVELVASLRHPNVVTVYDSGVDAEGRLYLAMEYVEGAPLAAGGSGSRAVGDTLRLFAKVCDAVSAAHRRGIIHRDLKPANILVGPDGEPKVLDFGLAKATTDDGRDTILATAAGEFLGTLAYAAPEQVAGDPALVDTRTDVYALGVIGYELLTGRRPLELAGSMADVVRSITEETPAPPSAVRPGLSRDVDTIILRALAKEPERRYQSVQGLLDDVGHFLAGEPLDARRHDRGYVLRKTVVRYRGVIGLAAAAFVLVSVAAVANWTLYVSATRAKRGMAAALGTALELIGALDEENPRASMPVSTVPGLLATGSRIVEEDLRDLPEVAAAVRSSLGVAYMSQSHPEEAEIHLTGALETSRRLYGRDDPRVAEALHNLGRLYWRVGPHDRAEALYREALAIRRAHFGEEHVLVARTLQHLASTLTRRGRLEEAERLHRAALAMRQRLRPPGHHDIAFSWNGLAVCLHEQGRYEEAIDCYRAALAIAEEEGGWQLPRALHSLGAGLIDVGNLDEAETRLRASLAIKRQTRGEDDPEVARSQHELARLHLRRGALAEADRLAHRALATRRARTPENTQTQADSLELLARIRLARDDLGGAETAALEALALRERLLEPGHWNVHATACLLGTVFLEQGRLDDAEARLVPATEALARQLGWRPAAAREGARGLADLYAETGRPALARRYRAYAQGSP